MLHLHSLSDPVTVDAYLAEMCRLMAVCEGRRPDLGNRPIRALTLAASGGVHQHPSQPATRLVNSRRAGFCHLVRLDLGTCTCPDFAAQVRRPGPRKPACKHLIAAVLQDLASHAMDHAADAAREQARSAA